MPPADRSSAPKRIAGRQVVVTDTETGRQSGSLMIVDDNPLVLRALAFHFSPNWDVVSAENGCVALSLLRSFSPNAIISDYQMPRLDGRQLAGAIRCYRHLRHVPFYLVSATECDEAELQRLGVTKVVYKPCDFRKLEEEIRASVLGAALVSPPIVAIPLPDDPDGFGATC